MKSETRYVEDKKMRRRNKTGNNYPTLNVCYLRKIWWGFLHSNSGCTDQALTLVGVVGGAWGSGSGGSGAVALVEAIPTYAFHQQADSSYVVVNTSLPPYHHVRYLSHPEQFLRTRSN